VQTIALRRPCPLGRRLLPLVPATLRRLEHLSEVLGVQGVQVTSLQVAALLIEQAGTPIGSLDLLIAAHALALGRTVVTSNTREFERVPGLKIENWAAD
jgi:tRNA(fMet)-specific endonuclease VapC